MRWRSLAPHQDPQHKVKRSTSARSREVRLLGGRVPFAFFASSREVAIARPASGPAT
ncbi:protein of unknown function [Methanoculleus bourgensis]|uniref:Uncharacterized protein n=1 Tax=Methanoculleus bourgensis TaxID=83986 RepID=A0A0X3BPS8_9EURY|nr:protein of unknown function [Methanoculleus bourgensis]